METCLIEGTTLVVTDVDVNELEYDSRFYYILRSRYRFLTSATPFKLMVSSIMLFFVFLTLNELQCQETHNQSLALPLVLLAYMIDCLTD